MPLPALDESDEFVRERVDAIAEDEALEPALRTDQLVRKATVVLENLAEGGLARGPLSHLAPKADFPARRKAIACCMRSAGPRSLRPHRRRWPPPCVPSRRWRCGVDPLDAADADARTSRTWTWNRGWRRPSTCCWRRRSRKVRWS
ncbi:MAG: hypothetical protein U5R48_01015 [Gammaproteobacteria bacterium]|nr:hypothetical protein [Gammaproteobacteria bacterium]